MSDQNKKAKPHKFESATWAEIEKFLEQYEAWYNLRAEADNEQDSGGQPTPPPPPPPGGH